MLFLVVNGGGSLNTATVGSSNDESTFVGASNVGSATAGGFVTSVVVEHPSVEPSNAPPAVVTVAAVANRKKSKVAQQGHKVTQCWHKTLFWVPC